MCSTTNKNKQISLAIAETRRRRATQACKTIKFKVDKSSLSKEQAIALKMLFVEYKWMYNYILDQDVDVFHFDYKKLSDITKKDKTGADIPVKIQYTGSSIRQAVLDHISNAIKALSALKKNGRQVGKLRFMSECNSINLKQYGVTHSIRGNKIKIQGIKKPIRVNGLKQLSRYDNIEYANAHLLYDGCDYYISLTCYVDKEIKKQAFIRDVIGLDFGIKTNITCSTGEKINIQVEESERLRKLQAKLAKKKKHSNNWYKTKSLIRKEYAHIQNKKNDIANKIVAKLLSENEVVVMQDEQIDSWKNKLTSKKIHHSILGKVKSKLKQNARVIILDKWFPTTKYCSVCGNKIELNLSDRTFVCQECGATEDRDIHAANNAIYFYLKYKETAGTVDTSKPVAIKFDKKFLAKQEDTTL